MITVKLIISASRSSKSVKSKEEEDTLEEVDDNDES